MKVMVSTGMRSASTTLHEMTRAIMSFPRRKFLQLKGPLEMWPVNRLLDELETEFATHGDRCAYKTHALPPASPTVEKVLDHFDDLRIVTITREPGDVVISLALYCRNTRTAMGQDNQPPVVELIEKYDGISDDEFCNRFIEECSLLPKVINEWAAFDATPHHPHVLQLQFNELTRTTDMTLDKLCNFLGKKPDAPALLSMANRFSFDNMKKTIKAQDFYRSGRPGQWKRTLTRENRLKITQMAIDARRQVGVPRKEKELLVAQA